MKHNRLVHSPPNCKCSLSRKYYFVKLKVLSFYKSFKIVQYCIEKYSECITFAEWLLKLSIIYRWRLIDKVFPQVPLLPLFSESLNFFVGPSLFPDYSSTRCSIYLQKSKKLYVLWRKRFSLVALNYQLKKATEKTDCCSN